MNQPEPTLDALISQFKNSYDESPRWIVSAPGRVNLIGEHTDYNLLPVLPMPISRAVRILVSPRPDNLVRFQNVDPQFRPFDVKLDADIKLSTNQWENYV